MTAPEGLTAASEALIADYHGRMHEDDCECDAAFIRDPLRAIEAAAVARHVRETGCDGLREAAIEAADWLELRPDYTEGDAATASRLRAALAPTVAASEEEPWKHYGVQSGCTHECHYTGWNTSGECCAES